MIQLVKSVQRLIATPVDNYIKETPFRFAKLEIKDGFWRLAVRDTYVWNF